MKIITPQNEPAIFNNPQRMLIPPLPPQGIKVVVVPVVSEYLVTIDNTANPNNLTDYQILVDLTGNTQYFEDAGENPLSTYFTDLAGSELPFWREVFDPVNKIAKFWVKVPFIPANDKAQIKMIVDKSRTVDTSDPYATFLLFDDFDDGVLDPNWTQVGHGYGDSQWIEQNGVVEGRTTDWNSLLYYKGFNENSICIDVDIMIVNADELQGIILRYEDSIDEGYSTELYDVSWWYTAFQTREIVQDGGNILAYYSMTFEKNVWYYIRTKTHQDRIIHELYKDDALLATLDVSGLTEHPSGSVGFLMDCWSAEVHAKWDNLRVRRYIPPEPTVTVEKIS